MTTPAKKRLMWDFKRLQKDPPVGISGAPQDNNIMHWNALIFGYNFLFCFLFKAWLCKLISSLSLFADLRTLHGMEVIIFQYLLAIAADRDIVMS
jgi:hypothetical protein